jgi:sporulation protein YlmC with PRC-barrel domain
MTLDARFHLLDRQIIDREDRLVGKVDDLELVERPDGSLAVTALLLGPGALGPRLGGLLGEWMVAIWKRLHPHPEPVPGRIPVGLITAVDSAVHVGQTRHELCVEGFEAWAETMVISRLPLLRQDRGTPDWQATEPDPGPPGARRVSQLLGHTVHSRAGQPSGNVSDLRLEFTAGAERLPVVGLVVNAGPVGYLFGPERRAGAQPWPVRRWARARRRHTTGYLSAETVDEVTWDTRQVHHRGERLGTFEP